jgi:hypothetical protein
MDALGGTAGLAGASRALAAALVRAGALGAAASLAQRFALAHEDERKLPYTCLYRAAFAVELMQEVLRAVGRHVLEVCTPCNIPCSQVVLAGAGVLSGAGAAAGGPAAG